MTQPEHTALQPQANGGDDAGIDLMAFYGPALKSWRSNLLAALVAGALGAGSSFLVKPTFTASNLFLPPQQQQGSAASALASLGALSGLAGLGSGKSQPEQYIALMQSVTVQDRLIKKFDLMELWDVHFKVDARKRLGKATSILLGKRDGLIRVEVTDTDPARAAAMANQYVEELRELTNTLAVTSAQQRRVFFEQLLQQTRDRLTAAQLALESSGYGAGALKAEPRSAAEGYSRLQAELTAGQVRLQVLRRTLADGTPEVQAAQESVNALTNQLAKLESQAGKQASSGDYIGKYREFKYQESLFELFARDYESARIDESREGALIQVVDLATPPERKIAPTRSMFVLIGALFGALTSATWLAFSARRQSNRSNLTAP